MSAAQHTERLEALVADLATERDVEAKNAEAEADMERPDCLCADHFPELRKADHDALLAADSNGTTGLVLFIEDLVARTENFRNPGELQWWHIEEFVAVHSWQQPVAMHRLARVLGHLLTPERELRQEALQLENGRRRGAA